MLRNYNPQGNQDQTRGDSSAMIEVYIERVKRTLVEPFTPFPAVRWPFPKDWLPVIARMSAGADWVPRTEIVEHSKSLSILVELPGVGAGNLRVVLEQDTLIIKGRKDKPDLEQQGCWILASDFVYGRFVKEIDLPEGLALESIKAHYSDGVLTVTVNKMDDTETAAYESE